MTSKLKCPFCEYELQENGLKNLCCPICGLVAPTKLWQALMQAKQDLEILKQALEKYADEDMWENCCKWDTEYIQGLFLEYGHKIAKEALEQIDHIADVSKMVEHKEI